MLAIVIMMIVILVLAGLVLAYAAYPHRGQEMPKATWLGEVMGRAAEAAPTVDREAGQPRGGAQKDDGFLTDRSGFFR